ncbi:disease resistance protein RUN1-like isoform X3 [Rosa rugosa]|uniref:disease resistance protein RUN1-like isoform X3 n=1 Tax=Rosa rugosa TaxID=74645 RepID=UPI002B4111A5|nr:disease resistance protein RUN1-like isoform X3 [Rosa rugosa]
MGGIGKTTIARVVYKRTSHEFDFSILLTNVRSNVEKSGLVNLQKKLLSGIWMKEDDILDLHQGAAIIRRFCHHKKVLLILDDVSHPDHLNFLAAKQEWFGIGSRVVITTRNEHLLIKHGVERRFKVWGLNNDEALQLFSRKAFRKEYPEKKFLGLSNSVVIYANGLPLAVEVLGASLNGRGITEWKSPLSKLGKVCNSEILDVLKMSYDRLDDEEKKIFLDIACFFNGEDKDRLTEILIACDVSAVIGIKVLIENNHVLSKNTVRDFVQEQSSLLFLDILYECTDPFSLNHHSQCFN